MTDLLRLVPLNLGFAAVGWAVLTTAGLRPALGWLPTFVGLAPATGLAACGIAATIAAATGLGATIPATAGLAVAALVAGRVARRGARLDRGAFVPPPSGWPGRIFELVALGALGVLSIRIFRLTAATGLSTWDGWAIWAPKAHALYREGDVWGPVFREPVYVMQHQEYPVLLPALEALSSHAIGRFDPYLIDIEASAVLVAFGWAAWGLLRLVVWPPLAAAVGLVLAASAPLIANVGANYADAVVASLVALGVLGTLIWLSTGAPGMLALAGVFLAAGALTKKEGLLFACATVVAATFAARGFGRSLRMALAWGGGVLAVAGLWLLVDGLNGPGAQNVDARALVDPGYVVEAADRIPRATAAMAEQIMRGWPVQALLAVIAVAAAITARLWWAAFFVGLWGLLAYSALVAVYFTSTSPIAWHLATSADRVVQSVVLTMATVAPVLLAWAWTRLSLPADADSSLQDASSSEAELVARPGRKAERTIG